MKRSLSYSLLLGVLVTMGLTACGGSSDDSPEQQQSYIQFYNGAASITSTSAKAGETSLGSATYGDASGLVSLAQGSYPVEIKNANDNSVLLTKELQLNKGDKTLLILTETEQQYNTVAVSFPRNDALDKEFKFYSGNLSQQFPQLDIYLAEENKPFSEATKIESLALNEFTSQAQNKATGKYNIYLTQAGQTTPVFETKAVDFRYTSTYVLIIRDKHGALPQQLALDIVLNSTTVETKTDDNAGAQFRVYNGLAGQSVSVELDNAAVTSLDAGQFGDYHTLARGDYSLSVKDQSNQLLLNSALLSINAGQSTAVVLYRNATQQAEALTVIEKDLPQQQSHDINVVNLVAEFPKLQFYFVRQNETISSVRYAVRNLDFKKQQSLNLPLDYYAIALVHIADNGSTTLLDKTDLLTLEPGKHYLLLAEQDNNSPSGYKVSLVK